MLQIPLHVLVLQDHHKDECSGCKKFLASDSFFEMNYTVWDISVSGVGSIHETTLEQVLSS
jgi:hypothetical protein